MKLTSPAFADNAAIPARFSQNGENHSPPLEFHDVPDGTKSLTLIMDDPDAPKGLFTHWVAFNIDPLVRRFAENDLPGDVHCGRNDAGHAHYDGPKPPDKKHRYFFHLYALDTRFDLPDGASRADVESAMQFRIIGEATLMGSFAPGQKT